MNDIRLAFLRTTVRTFLLLTFMAPRADAGPAAWTRTGPLEGGAVTALAIAPDQPATVYLGTSSDVAESGVFRSDDGGGTWIRVGPAESRNVGRLVVHPRRGSTVYAIGDGHLYRTRDGGAHWDHLVPWGPPSLGGVIDLVIDPSRPARLLATDVYPCDSDCENDTSALFESVDGGDSWTLIRRLPIPGASLAIDPVNPAVLYAGGNGSAANRSAVLRSVDGGRTWHGSGGGRLRGTYVFEVVVDPVNPETVYAGTWDSLFKSVDGGGSWRTIDRGLPDAVVTDLELAPDNPAVLYAATKDGLFMSSDGGDTWRPSPSGLSDRAIAALAVDPRTPSVLYAGTAGNGVLKSVDGGVSWRGRRRGLDLPAVVSLAVAPGSPAVLFAGTAATAATGESSGVYRSTNGGRSWSPANRGLPAPRAGVGVLAVDPRDPGTVYVAPEGQGLYKSVDGGLTWAAAQRGLDLDLVYPKTVLDLAVDPQQTSTLYAGTWAGVYKSTDAADSWSLASHGLPGIRNDTLARLTRAVAVDPRHPATVYAGVSHRVYRSDDGGVSWTATGLRLDRAVLDLAVDRQSGVVYAATLAGVYKSADGGLTWTAAGLPASARVLRIEVVPGSPGALYAAVDDAGVFRSTDGGESWTALDAGLPRSSVNAMAVAADGPVTVFAGFRDVAGVYEWEE